MDTISFKSCFITFKSLMNYAKQFSRKLEAHSLDPSHKLYSKDNKQGLGEMDFESAQETEITGSSVLKD